jgi:hypothetical protein
VIGAAFVVAGAVAIAVTGFVSFGLAGSGNDPSVEPVPTFEAHDTAQSIVVRVLFNSATDVEFVSGVVSQAPPKARIGGPPHIEVEVFDLDGALLEAFNVWHPLWVEAEGEDGEPFGFAAESGEGRFIFPFAPNIGNVVITDIELGQELIQIDAHQIVVDYCTANPSDPACASLDACPGDVDGDGVVTVPDLVATARAIPSSSGDPRWNPDADANGDGIVNVDDLKIVIASFLDPACR